MRLVRYLLYLYCVSDGLRNDFYSCEMASNFSHLESKTSQFEIVLKSLARFNAQAWTLREVHYTLI